MEIQLNDIVESYNQYISKIPTGCTRIVELFHQDQSVEALNHIADLSEGIGWLVSAKNYLLTNDINIDWDEKELIDYLEEINKGLELQDYVLVADLIEYEIIPFFEERHVIQSI